MKYNKHPYQIQNKKQTIKNTITNSVLLPQQQPHQMQSPHKLHPLTQAFIKQQLITRQLHNSSLRYSEIYCQMKKFIDNDIGESFYGMETQGQVRVVRMVMRVMERVVGERAKLRWVKVFAVHAFVIFVRLNGGGKGEVFEVLLEEVGGVLGEMGAKKPKENQQGFINRSLSKLKKSISSNRIGSLFLSQDKKNDGFDNIQRSILIQYAMYLQKLLRDWFYIQQFLTSSSITKPPHRQPLLTKQQKTNIIWKIFNIFKKLSKISKELMRTNQVIKEYTSYFFSMINFISEDMSMLYNPILDQIKGRILGLGQESPTKKTFESRGRIEEITQLKTIVEQIGNINEVVLFIFYGTFHHKYLHNKQRPQNFVSINSALFDVVYESSKRNDEKKRKLQLADSSFSFTKALDLKKTLSSGLNQFTIASNSNSGMNAVKYKSAKLKEMSGKSETRISVRNQADGSGVNQLTQTSVAFVGREV